MSSTGGGAAYRTRTTRRHGGGPRRAVRSTPFAPFVQKKRRRHDLLPREQVIDVETTSGRSRAVLLEKFPAADHTTLPAEGKTQRYVPIGGSSAGDVDDVEVEQDDTGRALHQDAAETDGARRTNAVVSIQGEKLARPREQLLVVHEEELSLRRHEDVDGGAVSAATSPRRSASVTETREEVQLHDQLDVGLQDQFLLHDPSGQEDQQEGLQQEKAISRPSARLQPAALAAGAAYSAEDLHGDDEGTEDVEDVLGRPDKIKGRPPGATRTTSSRSASYKAADAAEDNDTNPFDAPPGDEMAGPAPAAAARPAAVPVDVAIEDETMYMLNTGRITQPGGQRSPQHSPAGGRGRETSAALLQATVESQRAAKQEQREGTSRRGARRAGAEMSSASSGGGLSTSLLNTAGATTSNSRVVATTSANSGAAVRSPFVNAQDQLYENCAREDKANHDGGRRIKSAGIFGGDRTIGLRTYYECMNFCAHNLECVGFVFVLTSGLQYDSCMLVADSWKTQPDENCQATEMTTDCRKTILNTVEYYQRNFAGGYVALSAGDASDPEPYSWQETDLWGAYGQCDGTEKKTWSATTNLLGQGGRFSFGGHPHDCADRCRTQMGCTAFSVYKGSLSSADDTEIPVANRVYNFETSNISALLLPLDSGGGVKDKIKMNSTCCVLWNNRDPVKRAKATGGRTENPEPREWQFFALMPPPGTAHTHVPEHIKDSSSSSASRALFDKAVTILGAQRAGVLQAQDPDTPYFGNIGMDQQIQGHEAHIGGCWSWLYLTSESAHPDAIWCPDAAVPRECDPNAGYPDPPAWTSLVQDFTDPICPIWWSGGCEQWEDIGMGDEDTSANNYWEAVAECHDHCRDYVDNGKSCSAFAIKKEDWSCYRFEAGCTGQFHHGKGWDMYDLYKNKKGCIEADQILPVDTSRCPKQYTGLCLPGGAYADEKLYKEGDDSPPDYDATILVSMYEDRNYNLDQCRYLCAQTHDCASFFLEDSAESGKRKCYLMRPGCLKQENTIETGWTGYDIDQCHLVADPVHHCDEQLTQSEAEFYFMTVGSAPADKRLQVVARVRGSPPPDTDLSKSLDGSGIHSDNFHSATDNDLMWIKVNSETSWSQIPSAAFTDGCGSSQTCPSDLNKYNNSYATDRLTGNVVEYDLHDPNDPEGGNGQVHKITVRPGKDGVVLQRLFILGKSQVDTVNSNTGFLEANARQVSTSEMSSQETKSGLHSGRGTTSLKVEDVCKRQDNKNLKGNDEDVGGDMGRVMGHLTFEECQDFCRRYADCTGFVFVGTALSDEDNCAIKNAPFNDLDLEDKPGEAITYLRMTDQCRSALHQPIDDFCEKKLRTNVEGADKLIAGGTVYRVKAHLTYEECRDWCAENPDCAGLVHMRKPNKGNNCAVKGEVGGTAFKEVANNKTDYLEMTDACRRVVAPLPYYNYPQLDINDACGRHEDRNHEGNDLDNPFQKTYDECLALCAARSDCTGFAFYTETGDCQLKAVHDYNAVKAESTVDYTRMTQACRYAKNGVSFTGGSPIFLSSGATPRCSADGKHCGPGFQQCIRYDHVTPEDDVVTATLISAERSMCATPGRCRGCDAADGSEVGACCRYNDKNDPPECKQIPPSYFGKLPDGSYFPYHQCVLYTPGNLPGRATEDEMAAVPMGPKQMECPAVCREMSDENLPIEGWCFGCDSRDGKSKGACCKKDAATKRECASVPGNEFFGVTDYFSCVIPVQAVADEDWEVYFATHAAPPSAATATTTQVTLIATSREEEEEEEEKEGHQSESQAQRQPQKKMKKNNYNSNHNYSRKTKNAATATNSTNTASASGTETTPKRSAVQSRSPHENKERGHDFTSISREKETTTEVIGLSSRARIAKKGQKVKVERKTRAADEQLEVQVPASELWATQSEKRNVMWIDDAIKPLGYEKGMNTRHGGGSENLCSLNAENNSKGAWWRMEFADGKAHSLLSMRIWNRARTGTVGRDRVNNAHILLDPPGVNHSAPTQNDLETAWNAQMSASAGASYHIQLPGDVPVCDPDVDEDPQDGKPDYKKAICSDSNVDCSASEPTYKGENNCQDGERVDLSALTASKSFRYLYVVPHSRDVLNLCGVLFYIPSTEVPWWEESPRLRVNPILLKATQSSDYTTTVLEKLVGQAEDPLYYEKGRVTEWGWEKYQASTRTGRPAVCSHTRDTAGWWRVEFADGKSHTLSYMEIWNRGDCCRQRLNNGYVLVDPAVGSNPTKAELMNIVKTTEPRVGGWVQLSDNVPGVGIGGDAGDGEYHKVDDFNGGGGEFVDLLQDALKAKQPFRTLYVIGPDDIVNAAGNAPDDYLTICGVHFYASEPFWLKPPEIGYNSYSASQSLSLAQKEPVPPEQHLSLVEVRRGYGAEPDVTQPLCKDCGPRQRECLAACGKAGYCAKCNGLPNDVHLHQGACCMKNNAADSTECHYAPLEKFAGLGYHECVIIPEPYEFAGFGVCTPEHGGWDPWPNTMFVLDYSRLELDETPLTPSKNDCSALCDAFDSCLGFEKFYMAAQGPTCNILGVYIAYVDGSTVIGPGDTNPNKTIHLPTPYDEVNYEMVSPFTAAQDVDSGKTPPPVQIATFFRGGVNELQCYKRVHNGNYAQVSVEGRKPAKLPGAGALQQGSEDQGQGMGGGGDGKTETY
ncbi:unnamed protein product [Amoebophrya sp. A120]|nr:unnamed protein product [Amoebophrya sp. A120]|eukprot:GSA120T00016309001.1